MKRHVLTILLAGIFCIPLCTSATAATQEPTEEEQKMQNLPQWLVDFSNLPENLRNKYIALFNQAKEAYHQSQWVNCISLLAECEVIQRGNPSIWNLRASCMLEQKYFKEAEAELKRVLEAAPDDAVTIMNMAQVYMATGRYADSIAINTRLREDLYLQHRDESLLYALDYRILLCHLLLGQKDKAQAIASTVSPVTDTPLYHYAKAAFALVEGNRSAAAHYIGVANRIFAANRAYIPFQRSLELSGLLDATAPQRHP